MNTVELPNPETFLRKRIFGEKLTYRDLAKKIAILANGNDITGERPLNWTEIAKKLGIGIDLVRDGRDTAINLKFTELADGIYKKPKIDKQDYTSGKSLGQFREIPEIKTWEEFMEVARHGGKLKSKSSKLQDFKNMCDTLEIHPSTWINEDTPLAVFRKGDELIQKFVKLYDQDKTTIVRNHKKAKLDLLRYRMVQSRNSFSKAFGYQYPENFSATSSQSVKKFHGLYADVMLMPEQFKDFTKQVISYDGIDSDFFRWTMFGVESCSRKMAIQTAKCHYEKIPFMGKTAYVLQVFESKTEHLKNGIYKKYITIPEIQQSIDAVSLRSDYLIEDRSYKSIQGHYSKLKEIYHNLGISKRWLADPVDDTTGYCMLHATHALRHFGCQLWLQRLGFAAIALVAKMGGWNTIDEALASYGAVSDAQLLQEVERVWIK